MSIVVSPQLLAIIGGRQFRMSTRVTITRGSRVLARDLPVDVGREEQDITLRVPERVSLQIPKRVDGRDWAGSGIDSPIAPYGQRIHVKIGIQVGTDGWEWINRGEFLIHDSDLAGPTVTINAVGLLALVEEARLVSVYKPTGTIFSAVRKLLEPAVTVVKHPDLVDRAVPAGYVFDEDRLGAVEALLKGWPARMQMHPDGYLQLLPVENMGDANQQGTGAGYLMRVHYPENTFLRPNVTDVAMSATRDGIINAYVVRGETATGAPIQAVAYDRSSGPGQYGGPFNPLPVPEFFQTPLARSAQTARLVAASQLLRRVAPYSRSWKVQAIVNPTYLMNDKVIFIDEINAERTGIFTRLERLVVPYTASSGPMECTIRELEP